MQIATDKPYKIFAEVLEQGALDQFESAMQQPFAVRGSLMPDAHQGYTLPIGAVVATEGVVLPTTFHADDVREDAEKIFAGIYRAIPVGFNHNKADTAWPAGAGRDISFKMATIINKNGLKQLGSLGGGNHFIEIGSDVTGEVWIIIHSGSRGIGHATATHYMKLASGDGKAREGHYGFDVDSQNGADYIADLNFCLALALENRVEMMRRIVSEMTHHCPYGLPDWPRLINRNHNHAELHDGLWIHRKGATHAEAGMMGVIPGNMRDGSFIVRGKGNPDALWSSSHGAGRVLGRKEAHRVLNLPDFEASMAGVVARVQKDTLDESPAAYKDIFDVMRLQGDLVDVVVHVKPILNVKG